MSSTQRTRLEKIERLRRYYGSDTPEVVEWNPQTDETLNFAAMSDADVSEYLKSSK